MRHDKNKQTIGERSFRAMVRRAIDHHGEEFVNSYMWNKVNSRKRAMFVMGKANENNWSVEAKEKIAERAKEVD